MQRYAENKKLAGDYSEADKLWKLIKKVQFKCSEYYCKLNFLVNAAFYGHKSCLKYTTVT